MFKNYNKEKNELKKWLKHEAQFCSTEETTSYLKDYTFKFIDECIDELNNEGYFICLVEKEELNKPMDNS